MRLSKFEADTIKNVLIKTKNNQKLSIVNTAESTGIEI
jgi:hypothetical protein